MRVAEFLSDLTTLRPEVCVCRPRPPLPFLSSKRFHTTNHQNESDSVWKDQKSALSLVSLRPDSATAKPNDDNSEEDKDLKRARDLLDLHSTVKLAHADGRDRELMRAREEVGRVLEGL